MTLSEQILKVMEHSSPSELSAQDVAAALERIGTSRSTSTVARHLSDLARWGKVARFYRRDDCGGGLRYFYKREGGEWA